MGLRAARDWVRANPFLVDLALALLLLFFLLLIGPAGIGVAVVGYEWLLVLFALQLLPLALRRVAPFAGALLIAGTCLVQLLLTNNPLPSNVAVLIIIYSAAGHLTQRWKSATVLGMGLLGAVLAAADWTLHNPYRPPDVHPLSQMAPIFIFLAMTVAVAWVLGDVVRRRKAVVSRLREQNEALARDQAQREALAASGERVSIAREMHDIVAHSLSVVVVQADGGAYAARSALARQAPLSSGTDLDPGRGALQHAAQTLETLAHTAREALTDTRRLVGVLRESGSAAEYSPAQGLAHLEEMVQRLRDSGVPVQLMVRGDVANLSRELDLAAYRVIQESLTNVLKHAGRGARAVVDLMCSPSALLVRVTDDGAGRATGDDGHGNGIVGMRERVEVLGGTLYAGPRAQGGFEVVASMPIPQDRTQESAPKSPRGSQHDRTHDNPPGRTTGQDRSAR